MERITVLRPKVIRLLKEIILVRTQHCLAHSKPSINIKHYYYWTEAWGQGKNEFAKIHYYIKNNRNTIVFFFLCVKDCKFGLVSINVFPEFYITYSDVNTY